MEKSLSTELDQKFIVPILLNYVYWIIQEAEKRKIETLYFLARDGYILQKMAIQLCRREHISIHCKYLYCSRTSLRMPTYSLIGEESFDLLLSNGYQVSKKSLLERAELNQEQRYAVWADCGEIVEDEERLLNRCELEQLREKLKGSLVFRNLIMEKSKASYPLALGYLRQEGLLDAEKVAIVDSGWTGSMQRSLRQLLESAGFHGEIFGFYFGMYVAPKEAKDGTYLTYYFNRAGKIRDKVPFCNNLFECLLQAPHGMTLGYGLRNEVYFSQLALPTHETSYKDIRVHVQELLDIAWNQSRKKALCDFDLRKALKETRVLVDRYMAHPTAEEAALLGEHFFCDDVSESYHSRLACLEQTKQLKQYLIFRRIGKRLLFRSGEKTLPDLYWPYGTIAFLPRWKQLWYRGNVYLWEWIRYLSNYKMSQFKKVENSRAEQKSIAGGQNATKTAEKEE